MRLASERTGLEGMVEASTWHQVFTIASQHRGGPVMPVKTVTSPNPSYSNSGAKTSSVNNAAPSISSASGASPGPSGHATTSTAGSTATTTAGSKGTAASTTSSTTATTAEDASGNRTIRRTLSLSAMLPFSRDAEDKVSLLQMISYASIIAILAVIVHYSWAVSEVISTRMYITLGALIIVLLIIFAQEFIFISSNEEGSVSSKITKKGGMKGASTTATTVPAMTGGSPSSPGQTGKRKSVTFGTPAPTYAPIAAAVAASPAVSSSSSVATSAATKPSPLVTEKSFSSPVFAAHQTSATNAATSATVEASAATANNAVGDDTVTSEINGEVAESILGKRVVIANISSPANTNSTTDAVYDLSSEGENGMEDDEDDEDDDLFAPRPTLSTMPDSDDEN